MTSLVIYVLAILVASASLAWWLRRDLERAVARQRFEAQFADIRAQWVAFQRALGEALLPSMREAAAALHRAFAATDQGGRR